MSFIGPITKTAIFVASALIIIARAANAANAANAPAAVPAPVRRMANQDEASIIEGGKEDEEEEEVKVEEDEESVEGESIVEAGEFRKYISACGASILMLADNAGFQGQVQEGEDVASAVEDEGTYRD